MGSELPGQVTVLRSVLLTTASKPCLRKRDPALTDDVITTSFLMLLKVGRALCDDSEVSVSEGFWKPGLNGNMCDAFMCRCGSWYFWVQDVFGERPRPSGGLSFAPKQSVTRNIPAVRNRGSGSWNPPCVAPRRSHNRTRKTPNTQRKQLNGHVGRPINATQTAAVRESGSRDPHRRSLDPESRAGNNRKRASPFRSHSGICGICFGTNMPLPDPFPLGFSYGRCGMRSGGSGRRRRGRT